VGGLIFPLTEPETRLINALFIKVGLSATASVLSDYPKFCIKSILPGLHARFSCLGGSQAVLATLQNADQFQKLICFPFNLDGLPGESQSIEQKDL